MDKKAFNLKIKHLEDCLQVENEMKKQKTDSHRQMEGELSKESKNIQKVQQQLAKEVCTLETLKMQVREQTVLSLDTHNTIRAIEEEIKLHHIEG